MSQKELDRTEVLSKVKQKILTQQQAAEILHVSPRQVRRLFKGYKVMGAQALISKKRGKPSNHQVPSSLKELIPALIKEHYSGFGPTLAHEKLVDVHNIQTSVWTVRHLMITNGLWNDKKIKKKRIYQLRERRSLEGELIQMDGSPHDWFEERGSKCSLLHCIDDATGKIMAAHFAPSEAIWSYYELMRLYLKNHGRPVAIYNDKHAVFKVNKQGALSGEGITQFGRALQELDIKMIFAHSPQAKGRIERSNRTLQDRLTKELRLNKISTIKEANAFLPTFLEDYNRRFAVVPKDPNNAHKPLAQKLNLDLIFSIREFRQLSKNLTFQYKNVIYQVLTEREAYTLRKARIEIYEQEDGSIEVLYKNKSLDFVAYHSQQKQGEAIDSKQLNEAVDKLQSQKEQQNYKYKPPRSHPWKWGARRRPLAKALIE